MAARKLPRKYRRIFHVPKGIAYGIENSPVGVFWALKFFFRWIDMDMHVTKDGHVVFCHWNFILKDKFILPGWFRIKYGKNPKVSDVLLDDLLKLRSRPLKYRRKTYVVRYYTVGQMSRIIAPTKLGIACEPKGDEEFEEPDTWFNVANAMDRNGLDHATRAFVITLQNIGNPWARCRAARNYFSPVVLLARGIIPRERVNDFDYVRGRMRIR